ncbi:TRAP transporter substrate-binding protein DctP [uncultured Sneathiella sp.]|jgi:TRAP-type mannitol/chloroaromatic compound transport system substrate-binding protein|uniref:TRAP transporter substrate-binding protein DctP n=1 Tax=uncultured Sneathiella sp. TaxID=879315 RepID=UPI0030D77220|tara:strand:+ start:2076 stop:3152 length:1077 start_codon:yes stop_codon:yes gene_type:complete
MKLRKIALLTACSMVTAMTLNWGSGGTVATTAQAAEVDGPKVKWLLSTWGKRRGIMEGMESFSEQISKATDGNFEISLQYGGVLSDPKENLDGLKIRAFEAAMFCPIYHPSKTPAITALDLAFLPVTDLESRVKVHEAYLHNPVVLDELARWNAYPLMTGLMPNYEVMGKGKAPESLADWKGLRVNASGGIGDLMKTIGVVTTTVPAPEMYQSLERGVMDGVAFPYTYAFAAYKLHELSTWRTEESSLGSLTCVVAASKQAYEALPQQYKDLIDRVKPIAYQRQIDTYVEIDKKNEKLFEERGLKKVHFSDADVAKIKEMAVQPSWDAWVAARNAEGLDGQALLDSVLTLAEEAKKSK